MGGRGSKFKITSGKSNINFYGIDYQNETYTNKPTKDTDYLKDNKKTWTMSTTDFIKRDLMNSQTEFLKKVTNKYPGTSSLLTQNNNLRIRAVDFKNKHTLAAFVSPGNGSYEKLQICYNSSAMKKSINQIKEEESKNQNNGYFSPSDDDMLINKTLAHEYGHFIEKTLVEKEIQNNVELKNSIKNFFDYDRCYYNLSKKFSKEILKIKKDKFNDNSFERISKYAQDSYPENFAEIFCNLVTQKNPTNWAKAMKIFLKEKGICVK